MVRELVDAVVVDRFAVVVSPGVEYAQILLTGVEEQAGEWLAVVAIKEDGTIALRIAHGDAGGIHVTAGDGL